MPISLQGVKFTRRSSGSAAGHQICVMLAYSTWNEDIFGRGNPIVIAKANTQGEERTLLNAFVTWESCNEKVEVTAYGKNLTDQTYRVGANPVATLWNFTRHAPPRELGLQIGYKF